VWKIRLNLSHLAKNFHSLEPTTKEQIRRGESKKLKLEARMEEAKASRFTPERIRLLRKKLGISQKDLGILAGVSLSAVASWEKGKFHPNLNKKATLVAIRKLRKREVKKILASKRIETKNKSPRARKTKKAKGKGGR
ncbi:MAG: helix-turn-helix domain-containing protein, partial [Deltaproteobacteria bacterium]|nr:helix-turn-helix domain-containing protein [Deltaproteobacteria bacterium]